MEKVEQKYLLQKGQLPWVFSAASPLFDIEYADDTVLLGRSADVVESFLEILISEAEQVGLLLNFDKCEHIAVHSENPVRFLRNGSTTGTVPRVNIVKYLGVLLSPTSSSTPETNRRLSQARTAFKLLKPFFTHMHQTKQHSKSHAYTHA